MPRDRGLGPPSPRRRIKTRGGDNPSSAASAPRRKQSAEEPKPRAPLHISKQSDDETAVLCRAERLFLSRPASPRPKLALATLSQEEKMWPSIAACQGAGEPMARGPRSLLGASLPSPKTRSTPVGRVPPGVPRQMGTPLGRFGVAIGAVLAEIGSWGAPLWGPRRGAYFPAACPHAPRRWKGPGFQWGWCHVLAVILGGDDKGGIRGRAPHLMPRIWPWRGGRPREVNGLMGPRRSPYSHCVSPCLAGPLEGAVLAQSPESDSVQGPSRYYYDVLQLDDMQSGSGVLPSTGGKRHRCPLRARPWKPERGGGGVGMHGGAGRGRGARDEEMGTPKRRFPQFVGFFLRIAGSGTTRGRSGQVHASAGGPDPAPPCRAISKVTRHLGGRRRLGQRY